MRGGKKDARVKPGHDELSDFTMAGLDPAITAHSTPGDP
jgi:hypothetical protein